MYPRTAKPLGISWERWAAIWCKWQLSIPRTCHPALDHSGVLSARNQDDPHVWFLTGTFGNSVTITRNCRVPEQRSILFPIIYKEDSFIEDKDLKNESELRARAKAFADSVRYLSAAVDGKRLGNLNENRVRSEFFDLVFPTNSVYDVNPGSTKAICDGYWIFLKPLTRGRHNIHFTGIASLERNDIVTEQIKNDSIYAPFRNYMEKYSSFKVDVIYELLVE